MVVFAIILAVAHNNQGVGVIFEGSKTGNIFQFPAPFSMSFFLVAMFMSLYVIYGFDTASTLAEETHNPRQEGPKAVLAAVIGAFVIGAIFLWALLIAIPDMGEAVATFASPPVIISEVLSTALSSIYLFVVAAAIFVCCMAIMTATIRLAFGMARDDQLPFSKTMAKVSPRLHTPVATCIIIGLLSAIPFIQFSGPTVIAVGATASIYFSYLLGNFAVMRARMRGWPKTKAPFSLGRWG
jgi:amino acid transporter